MMPTLKNFAAGVVLSTAVLLNYACFAGDWQKDWSTVEGQSAKKCAELFDSFQLHAVCMENEKRGYDEMQSDFSLPADITSKAKDRCAKVFDSFQLQAVCMQNEQKGFEKMRRY